MYPNLNAFQLQVLLFSSLLHKHTPKTFTEFWIGPYTVTRQISPVVFEIQKNDNPEKKTLLMSQD